MLSVGLYLYNVFCGFPVNKNNLCCTMETWHYFFNVFRQRLSRRLQYADGKDLNGESKAIEDLTKDKDYKFTEVVGE